MHALHRFNSCSEQPGGNAIKSHLPSVFLTPARQRSRLNVLLWIFSLCLILVLLLFGLCLTAGAGTATAERFLYHRVVWRRSGFLPV